MAFGQYLKDTQTELRHVAWPTRLQTIIYTVLVAVISIVVALYLGLFDYVFTSGLTSALRFAPPPAPTRIDVSSTTTGPQIQISTSSGAGGDAPRFGI